MQDGKRISDIFFQIKYKPKEYDSQSIRIFGKNFVNTNKNKCKIIYNNKIYELKEYFEEIDINYNNNENQIKLKLKIFNNIINMSYMFCECNTLLSLQYLSKSRASKNLKKERVNYSDRYDLIYSSIEDPNFDFYKKDGKENIYSGCDQELISSLSSIKSKNDDSNINYQRNLITIKNALSFFFHSNDIYLSNKNKEKKDIKLISNGQIDNNPNLNDIVDEINEISKQKPISSLTKRNKSNIKEKNDGILENNLLPFTINLNIIDLGHIFEGCNSLISLLDISKWNTSSVKSMNSIFSRCKSLKSLPDISKWNTEKVRDMESMFFDCNSLISLPDISKWNTENVINMGCMFCDCNSFELLPDLSKFNTTNCYNMESLFNRCNSLLSLPNISKWNTSNVINMSYMFQECKLLKTLPDISEWNTSNVIDFSYMFDKCISLLSLPDISKWNTSIVLSMRNLFSECNSIIFLPDISKWNTEFVTDFSFMFSECSSLISVPDISKWNTENVSNFNCMFSGCISLKSLPEITKWNFTNAEEMKNIFKGCKSLISLPDISKCRDFYLFRNLAIATGKYSLIIQSKKWNYNNINLNHNDNNFRRNVPIKPIYINIIYKTKENKEDNIKLFGENFIKNNKDKCKIIYNDKEYEIKQYFYDFENNYKYPGKIKLKLKIFATIINMSSMFDGCDTLLSFQDILQNNEPLNKEQIASISLSYNEKKDITNALGGVDIFSKDNPLSSLINSKVTNVSQMFSGCKSLISLPDISKWNTENIIDMSYMFYDCNSLISLPDISKWNTENVTNMDRMFCECHSLISLPNISNWKTGKVTHMISVFSFCISLNSLPDLSKWNISNVTNMSWMFSGCLSLTSLPNFSKWDNFKVDDKFNMFLGCFNCLNN